MPKQAKRLSNSSGFTLIELLVVILVIGALSGVLLGVVNSSGVRAKARDSRRKADLTKIQTALELYFADRRAYPVSPGSPEVWEEIDNSSNIETALEDVANTYLDPVPQDPTFTASTANGNPCDNPTVLRYNYYSDGNVYKLTAIMEVSTSNDDSPCTAAASSTNCGGTFTTGDVCYFARNP